MGTGWSEAKQRLDYKGNHTHCFTWNADVGEFALFHVKQQQGRLEKGVDTGFQNQGPNHQQEYLADQSSATIDRKTGSHK